MTPMMSFTASRHVRDQRGIALMLVLLLVLAVGALALAAITLSGNSTLINAWDERQDELETVAEAGLEAGRSKLNASRTLFPDTGYATLENGVAVVDATGRTVPGVTRSTYGGPIGVSTGQYGVFGSVISIARYANGDRVVRRADITQESFAKYAYFTDVEPANISFGGGDQIQGPVHSNDVIKIYSSGATFKGPGMVTTAQTISGRSYGTFVGGYKERAGRIEMPATAELGKLQTYAAGGGTSLVEPVGGNPSTARMRIEFLWLDLNQNNVPEPDEGFYRVFVSNDDWFLMGIPNGALTSVRNCGYWQVGAGPGRGAWVTPANQGGLTAAQKRALLQDPRRRCFLGGDPTFQNDSAFAPGAWNGPAKEGWVPRPFPLPASIPARLANRPDVAYLYPLSRTYNANFKGVIHVSGSVALSGTVRGRVTIAATDNIYIADDLNYSIQPGGSSDCSDVDMVGLFAGGSVIVSDNALNTPQQIQAGGAYFPFDDSNTGVFLQGVVLALDVFTVQNFDQGPTATNACENLAWGRGCLYLSGGVIQSTRGAVGQSDGHGFLKRYSYDVCAAKKPPPYFPTTGRFSRSRYYEIDPVNFDVATFYRRWSAG